MEYLTESNVNKYMLGVFAFAGALKAVGLGNKAMVSEMKYPAWFGNVSGLMELAGAALLYNGAETAVAGLYLLLSIMGGAMYTMATGPTPAALVMPGLHAYSLFWLLQLRSAADPALCAAALAAGVLGGVVLHALGKGIGKKAVGKKAAALKSK